MDPAADKGVKRVKNSVGGLVWSKVEVPVTEIVAHLVVTALSIISIVAIELLLIFVKLDGKYIPHTNITLRDWMFDLEVLAATLIILVGIVKAVLALARS
jgi:hypothetical protein